MAITVAQIRIEIQGDASGAIRPLQEVATAEQQITQHAKNAAASQSELTTILVKSAASAKDIAVGFAAAATGMSLLAVGGVALGRTLEQSLAGGVKFLTGAVFGMNASLETATLQFQTLMGDAERAKQHVEGLFKFAKETPFETAPVIQASLALRAAGGDALDTEKSLRLVGDAAAGVSAPIQEVAMWFGRAFSALQAGRPFGEAAERLQELNIISGTTRNRLESLQESGATSREVFQALELEFLKFSGSMKLQEGTWQGLTSTFADSANILISRAFRPLFGEAKQTLGRINEFLDTKAADTWAEHMGAAIKDVISALSGTPQSADPLKTVLESLPQTIENAASGINTLKGNIDRLTGSPGFNLFLIAIGAKTAQEGIAQIPSLFQPQPGPEPPPGRQVSPMSALDQARLQEQLGGTIRTPAERGFADVRNESQVAAVAGEELAAAFTRGFSRGEVEKGLSQAGRDSIRLLQEAVDQGKPELAEAAGKAAQSFSVEIEKGLGPFQGAALARQYMDAVTQALLTKDPELAAAAVQLGKDIGLQITNQQEAERVAAAIRQQQQAAKQAAEEEKRRIRELAITGFIDERDRQAMVTKWGKLGSDSVVALSTALADPASTRSAGEALAKSVTDLTTRLEEAGVPEFREVGARLMLAAEQALRGQISQGEFQSALREAIGHLPQLTVTTGLDPTGFEQALAASQLPSSAHQMGELMRKSLQDGFISTSGLGEFQRSAAETLRLTDALGVFDPQAARRYAESFVNAEQTALTDVTPEAIATFEAFLSDWAQNIKLETAKAGFRETMRKATQALTEATQDALRGQRANVFDMLEHVFTERGGGGVNVDAVKARVSELLGSDILGEVLGNTIGDARSRILDVIDQTAQQFASATSFRDRQQNLQDELDHRIQSLRDEQRAEVQSVQDAEASKARARSHAREDEDQARNRGREDRDLAINRQREQFEATLQFSRQVAEAQKRGAKPEEIGAMREQFERDRQDRSRQNQYEDQDRQRRRGDQETDRRLALVRETEDVATQQRQRQEALTLESRQQKAMQDQQRANQRELQRFNDQQADDALARQLVRNAVSTQDTINKARQRWKDEEAEASNALERIRTEVWEPSWRQYLLTAKEEFFDPAMDLMQQLAAVPVGFFPGIPRPASLPAPLAPEPSHLFPDKMQVDDESISKLGDVMNDRPIEVNVDLGVEQMEAAISAEKVRKNRTRTIA